MENQQIYPKVPPYDLGEQLRECLLGFEEAWSAKNLELEVEIEPEDKDALYRKFAIRFAQNEIYHTKVSYRLQESTLKIDRKFSGSRRAIIHQRRAKVSAADGKIKLRLILDRYSVEVFVNDGEKAMTATLYTDQEADGISFMADGKVKMNVVKWDLMDE